MPPVPWRFTAKRNIFIFIFSIFLSVPIEVSSRTCHIQLLFVLKQPGEQLHLKSFRKLPNTTCCIVPLKIDGVKVCIREAVTGKLSYKARDKKRQERGGSSGNGINWEWCGSWFVSGIGC